MRKTLIIISAAVALCFSYTLPASSQQRDLCEASYIETFMGIDGPLKGCKTDDTVHFQIANRKVAYSSVVARYCNLQHHVSVEISPDQTVAHVVCIYQWKARKIVQRTKNPDKL